MDKGTCFIINKCNFETGLIERIKSTLLKNENFNVAFEFGYARGIDQKVILLFDGDLRELPMDINRDYAISSQDPNLLSKIEALIINIEEQKEKRLTKLPQELLDLFIGKATVNDFDEFARLLDEFSSSFKLL